MFEKAGYGAWVAGGEYAELGLGLPFEAGVAKYCWLLYAGEYVWSYCGERADGAY